MVEWYRFQLFLKQPHKNKIAVRKSSVEGVDDLSRFPIQTN